MTAYFFGLQPSKARLEITMCLQSWVMSRESIKNLAHVTNNQMAPNKHFIDKATFDTVTEDQGVLEVVLSYTDGILGYTIGWRREDIYGPYKKVSYVRHRSLYE